MSVIIKDLNVPSSCYECEWIHNDVCVFTGAWVGDKEDERSDDCPVSAERRGKWIEVQRINPTDRTAICECSICGDTVWVYDGQRTWNYCPNCGARMDAEE